MPEERRNARRARLSGVHVTYESASGEVREAEVTNLGREGLFIATTTPLAAGKRLSLEIQVAGESGPWAALGRVVWVRAASDGDDLPAGMAIKIIDVDESAAAAIDRLIEIRERTEPGLGAGGAAPPDRPGPAREKTMLGVGGAAASPPAAVAAGEPPLADPALAPPPAAVLPSREKTMLGVGLGTAGADPRDPSVAIDLVARKPPSAHPPAASEPPRAPAAASLSEVEARESQAATDRRLREFERAAGPADEGASEAPRRRSIGWGLLLALVVALCAAAYVFRDRLLPLWQLVVTDVARRLR
jgi:uncharacterized protein (TIGR02266 family)